jgi:hypothetical protein
MTLKSGRLGVADIPAGQDFVVYTCGSGAGNTAVAAGVTISLCNCGSNQIKFRVSVCLANAPVAGEYLEYDTILPVGGVFERTGKAVSAGERVVVRCDVAGGSVRVEGFEK